MDRSNGVGFVGLGNMGGPMAANLVASGRTVHAFDRERAAVEAAVANGANGCGSLAATVRDAGTLVTMLPDGDAVLGVLGEILTLVPAGTAVIDCSTIDIEQARGAHALASEAGLRFVDAPVSGGVTGARAGTLTMMAGGDEALLASLAPILEPMTARVIHCGGAGAGQAAKLCNNLLLAISMAGSCEALALGQKLGLDPARLFEVLSTSSGSCWSINSYCPLPGIGPTSPADDGYRPGFPAHLMVKDVTLAERAAGSVDQATPLGDRALALYREFVEAGHGTTDFSGIIEHLARATRD